MKNVLCAACGKDAYRNSLCRDHFLQAHRLATIRDFSILLCRSCGSYYDGKWRRAADAESSAAEAVKKREPSVEVFRVSRKANMVTVKVKITGKIAGMKKTEQADVKVLLRRSMCDVCVKASGGYYEAMIQLRGDEAEALLERALSAKEIIGVAKVRGGYDIKVMAKAEARRVVSSFEGRTIKKSYKHVTTKKGKMIFRDCYSVR